MFSICRGRPVREVGDNLVARCSVSVTHALHESNVLVDLVVAADGGA